MSDFMWGVTVAAVPQSPPRPFVGAAASSSSDALADNGPRCRRCGCTDMDGCPGGCFWVHDPEGGDLCDQCLDDQWFAMKRNHTEVLAIRRDLDRILENLSVARSWIQAGAAKRRRKGGAP